MLRPDEDAILSDRVIAALRSKARSRTHHLVDANDLMHAAVRDELFRKIRRLSFMLSTGGTLGSVTLRICIDRRCGEPKGSEDAASSA
jgi:hypothetical protein